MQQRFQGHDIAADSAFALAPVERTEGTSIYETTLTPALVPNESGEGERYVLGVTGPTTDLLHAVFGVRHKDYSLGESVVAGSADTIDMITLYGRLIGRLFTGKDDVRESVGGPVMIAQVTKQAADAGMEHFWYMVAMLSIALAVFNILPIPVLDGGHLVFLLYEGITRREPSVRFRMVVQQVGFVLLLAFMAFVIFNDFTRL